MTSLGNKSMNKFIDEYISKYGESNTTGIKDMDVALAVNRIRKDKEKLQKKETEAYE